MSIKFERIPDYMMRSIRDYVDNGRPMGGFLTAVFANDLHAAIAKADDENIKIIREYVSYVWWECPGDCHGSYEIIDKWMSDKRKKLSVDVKEQR